VQALAKQFNDKIDLAAVGAVMTPEGYLDVSARISRAGIYEYYAGELYEIFKDRKPDDIVRVYRPADEVFNPASMASFARKPVTDGHPWENVTASNIHEHSVGLSGETMQRDGNFVAGRLLIQRAEAVNKVQRGERELSAGYVADVTRETGIFDNEPYDAVMRNIVGNHIALVETGRCGAFCRVGDRAPVVPVSVSDCACQGNSPMNAITPPALQARVFDGLPINLDAASAPIFDKMAKEFADTKTKLDAAEAKILALDAGHKTALADKDKQIADLTAKQLTPAQIDALVADRGRVKDSAKRILGDAFDFTNKTDADIKSAAVVARMGADAIKDKAPEIVTVMFDTLIAAMPKDGSEQQFTGLDTLQQQHQHQPGYTPPAGAPNADKAYEERNKHLTDAWKGPQGQAQH